MNGCRVESGDGPLGRRLVATEPIAPGAALLSCSPYAASVKDEALESVCHQSFRISDSLQRCGGCRFAWYASRGEQAQAWKQGHKEECRALQRAAPRHPGPALRLVAKILWKRLRGGTAPPEQGGGFSDVEGLVHHWERLDDDRMLMYAQAAVGVRQFMSLGGVAEADLPDTREVARLFARVACNGHTIVSEEEQPLGLGLFPLGSMVNHSCAPNAAQCFAGRRLVVRALRAIHPGEEVTIAYLTLDQTRPERRQFLKDWYQFDIDAAAAAAGKGPAEPLARLWEEGTALPIQVSVWQRPPWPLDARDAQLMGLGSSPGGGAATEGNGVMAALAAGEGHANLAQAFGRAGTAVDAGFPWDAEALGCGGPGPPASDGRADPRRRKRLVVDCWGPAFLQGGGVREPELRQLARKLLGLCCALQAGEDQRTLAFNCDDGSGPFTLGRLHVLRCRLLEAQVQGLKVAQQWRAALQPSLTLRDYYALVYPQTFPPTALHEASIAKIAAVVGEIAVQQEAASRAVRQLRVLYPDSEALRETVQLLQELQLRQSPSRLA